MIWIKILNHLLVIVLLTILTQVGGVLWLMLLLVSWRTRILKTKGRFITAFIGIYLVFNLFIIPFSASLFGRVALPIWQNKMIKPAHYFMPLMNRHYVKSELYNTLLNAQRDLVFKSKNGLVLYLDANFPFVDGFSLLPHLSHNDGKKLDLAFVYVNNKGKQMASVPSPIGYGVCEVPKVKEYDMPKVCATKGYRWYNMLYKIFGSYPRSGYIFDPESNKALIESLMQQKSIKKVFLEPHLVKRLGLKNDKIRFHGCHAVRHDDHIHVQL